MEIETSNTPIINLRREFEEYLRLFRSDDFSEKVFNCHNEAVRISSLTWHGLPNELLTLMLQRAILGLESYISAAVVYEIPLRLGRESEKIAIAEKPYSLGGNIVAIFYKKLPGLMGPEFELSSMRHDVYYSLQNFYKNVRNPIFHGSQVAHSTNSYSQVASSFELLAEVYDWIDTWYSAFPFGWNREGTHNNSLQARRP